jgi:NADPH:quinone reductase-like Zn-dependent oxidoreductase
MQHLVLTHFGNPEDSVHLAESPDPVPGAGKVLVRLIAAAINPADLMLIQGQYLVRPTLPAGVGAEGVGVVEAVGPGVDHRVVGKHVIVLPTHEYGIWSDKVVVAQTDVVEVPHADPLQLAMLSVSPVTAHLLLDRVTGLGIGDWVGQTAANSAVGRHVISLAKRRGIKTLNIVRRDEAADEVRRAGGDIVLVAGADLGKDIADALGDEQLSLVLDPLGGSAATHLIAALTLGGSVVTYAALTGLPSGPTFTDLFVKEIRYAGFGLRNWYSRASRREIVSTLRYLASLVADGDLLVPVEATYRLGDYLQALKHAQAAHRVGKVLFTFE